MTVTLQQQMTVELQQQMTVTLQQQMTVTSQQLTATLQRRMTLHYSNKWRLPYSISRTKQPGLLVEQNNKGQSPSYNTMRVARHAHTMIVLLLKYCGGFTLQLDGWQDHSSAHFCCRKIWVPKDERGWGGEALICCLPWTFWPLTMHPFRDRATFLLLIRHLRHLGAHYVFPICYM